MVLCVYSNVYENVVTYWWRTKRLHEATGFQVRFLHLPIMAREAR